MATSSSSPPRPGRPGHALRDDLIVLAGTPDDESDVPALLRSITQLATDLLPPVSYASVTVKDNDSYSTVAMSSELALAVDEAQYADDAGPCLDTIRTGEPTAVRHIDATVQWPRFRDEAHRLGLVASLSIPLFAGRGIPIAALNLYGHDSASMTPLSAMVLTVFESSQEDDTEPHPNSFGPGPRQLLDGLIGAFRVRSTIQRALGVIMAMEHTTADLAYGMLRARAEAKDLPLSAAAGTVLTEAGGEQYPA